jgi:hypothetical protein
VLLEGNPVPIRLRRSRSRPDGRFQSGSIRFVSLMLARAA